MSKYDIDAVVPDAGDSHAVMLDLVGPSKRVLDVGCASGYLARALIDGLGCTVAGVESDPEAAEKARDVVQPLVVGDLDLLDLAEELEPASFDVVVFGDVLEHLRDPVRTLRQARALLAPGGYVVISIPNVAHGDLGLSLLRGDWTYRPLGLLDNTHLRFFTHEGVRRLAAGAGFALAEVRRIKAGLFHTEFGRTPDEFPPEVVDFVRAQPEHETYQFVVRAVPDDADGAVAALAEREETLRATVAALETRLREAEATAAWTEQVARDRDVQVANVAAQEARADALAAEVAALRRELTALRTRTVVRASSAARRLATGLRGSGR
jgi:2-polyprenyl-3-methyl-5-hydroxy-6-metoxy-1,4-benzoquinol methylase